MTTALRWLSPVAASAALLLTACPPVEDTAEEDLGPIEQILDEVTMTVWPGVEGSEGRHVRRVNGFFNGGALSLYAMSFVNQARCFPHHR